VARGPAPELERRLSTLDVALLTIGSVVGTGIFLTPGSVAAAVPHPGLILLTWLAGGTLALFGALTLAEPATALPEAGGLYVVLREAFGRLPAFLYGWACFLIILSGGIATIAMGFGAWLGEFVPAASSKHVLLQLGSFSLNGQSIAASLAILLLTAVNHIGLGPGKGLQNLLTWSKVLAIAGFGLAGLMVLPAVRADYGAPLPAVPGGLLAGFGVAMIAVLWTYDGWYGPIFEAGEMKDPSRALPRGLVLGIVASAGLYALLNVYYLRALPLDQFAGSSRAGATATGVLLGDGAARLFSALVVVSSFGCLAATILYASRLYLPMARDGVFFAAAGRVHPRHHTPSNSLWMQGAWAIVLTLSGSYEQLYNYVTFASVLFLGACGGGALWLRFKRPDLPRPFRTWGWPVVPLLFLGGCVLLTVSTLVQSPKESGFGLGLVALGLPAYAWWRRRSARGAGGSR
jgi:APA family basic amino acid/polyamine antiporter